MPSISIILPTHNRAALLREAIESVIAQTYQDWELLVVDDGSTDATRQVMLDAQRRDARIHYLHQEHGDNATARNAGLRIARGALVAFLDDDDVWLPQKLERQIAAINGNLRIGLVACGAYQVNAAGERLKAEWPDFNGMAPRKVLLRVGCIIRSFSGVMIRRTSLDAVGGLDPSYGVVNDYEWYLRLAEVCNFAVVPEPLYHYRLHGDNISRNGPVVREQLIRLLARVQRSADWVSRHHLDRRLAKLHYEAATDAVSHRDFHQAARHYGQAIWRDPLVGRRIQWGRWNHWLYRAVRPYGAFAYCTWRSHAGH